MANLFIIAAPSGCGKTSLVKALIERLRTYRFSFTHHRKPEQAKLMEKTTFSFSTRDLVT